MAAPWPDASAQAEQVRAGLVHPTELVDEAIARIEELNPQLNAVIHPRFERARKEAADELPDGPLRGVPFVLKDLDGTSAGDPYHAGCRFLRERNYIAPADSWLTARFRAAGLVLLGRTNTPELGLVPTTEPELTGPTRNPWDLDRSTGGSSGGSAAAVASGMVAIGHAGDGGGSIRIPASECGLVGLKPSRGRISLGPEVGEAWGGLVSRLAVTRSVRDTAVLLDAVAGPGVGDPYTAPPPSRPYADEVGADPGVLRIGWTTETPDEVTNVHPEVAAAVERTAHLLESLGHQVEPAAPSALGDPELALHFGACFSVWVAADLDRLGSLVGSVVVEADVEPGTWALAEMGRAVTGAQYVVALDALHAHTRRVVGWWSEGHDLLLTPTIPEPAPTLGSFTPTADNPLQGLFRATEIVPFTAPFNVSGQPAISLPLHLTSAGLPIGVQLVADAWREDVLVKVATQLEAAAPWAERRPPVHA